MALALRGAPAHARRRALPIKSVASRAVAAVASPATRRAVLVVLAVLPFALGWSARKLVLGVWLVTTWLLATVVLGWRMAGPAARSTDDDDSEGAAPWVGSNA
jgi:hypothetical protein